jgi:hypothetical protein
LAARIWETFIANLLSGVTGRMKLETAGSRR